MVDAIDHHRSGWSSSAAKKVSDERRIEFARRSSRTACLTATTLALSADGNPGSDPNVHIRLLVPYVHGLDPMPKLLSDPLDRAL